ncbi:MAG: glycoside hydrolase family 3 protein [Spirochaetia bacterium]|nr:glycoside hydrolase family 3 protein [Spirochaetia bacterium]
MNQVFDYLKKHFRVISVLLSASAVISVFLYLFIQDYRIDLSLRQTPEMILQQMTLEEKVGQLIHVGINGKSIDSYAVRDIQKLKAGGVILFANNIGSPESIKKLNGELQNLASHSTEIPLFISIDQEGGRIARIPDDSSPGAMAIGQTANVQYAEDVGFLTAYRLRDLGFNLLLAPVLDVNNNPENPVINTRSFGSSPELVASMGISHSKGIRKAQIVPVIKHFPGHGDTDTDSHLALPRINKSYEELEKMELIPFKKSIENGAEALMSAHILFPALDSEEPATLSPKILRGILREKLKYNGLILTDAMEMHAISKRYKPEESIKKAFLAGADIILLTTTGRLPEKAFKALHSAFQSGELSIEDLDRAVLRQISLKYKKGYFHQQNSKYAREDLSDYFNRKKIRVNETFLRLENKYKKKTLYSSVADDSIRSLKKDYSFPSKDKENIQFYYSTSKMKKYAELKIPVKNIQPLNFISLLKSAENNPSNLFIVEVNEFNLKQWNRFADKINLNQKMQDSDRPHIIALYNGNPFFDIKVSEPGAVFLSFSPTDESLEALLNVCLEKKVVKKANLVFTKLK